MRSHYFLAVLVIAIPFMVAPTEPAQAQSAPPKSLVDDELFASPESNLEQDFKKGAPEEAPQIKKASLDVDVLLSLIVDRSRRAAIRAVADTIRKAGKTADRVFISDLLEMVAGILTQPVGPERQEIEAIAGTILRAVLSESIVRSVFPDDASLIKAKNWVERIVDEDRVDLSTLDGPTLRKCLVDLAYWRLADTPLFATPRPAAPPCSPGNEIASALSKMLTKDDGRNLARLLGIDELISALPVIARIKTKFNLEKFLGAYRSLKRDDVIASFETTEGMKLEDWKNMGTAIASEIVERTEPLSIVYQALSEVDNERKNVSKTDPGKLKQLAEKTSQLLAKYRESLVSSIDTTSVAAIQEWLDRLKKGDELDLPPVALTLLLAQGSRMSSAAGNKTSGLGAIAKLNDAIRTIEALSNKNIDSLGYSQIAEVATALNLAQSEIKNLRDVLLGMGIKTRDVSMRKSLAKLSSVKNTLKLAFDLGPNVFGNASLRQVFHRVLSFDPFNKSNQAELFEILQPVLDELQSGASISGTAFVRAMAQIPADRLLSALSSDGTDACKDHPASARCWMARILRALQASIDLKETRAVVDGEKLVSAIASLGDDFRHRDEGRLFFHLTVGTGELFVLNPPRISNTKDAIGNTISKLETGTSGFVPIVSEQIGFGYATPAFWHDRLTFKAGVFASGILYRLVMDTEESDAIVTGLFTALDVYDTVEIYMATPSILFYPRLVDSPVTPRLGFSLGLQVPLGDYLSRL